MNQWNELWRGRSRVLSSGEANSFCFCFSIKQLYIKEQRMCSIHLLLDKINFVANFNSERRPMDAYPSPLPLSLLPVEKERKCRFLYSVYLTRTKLWAGSIDKKRSDSNTNENKNLKEPESTIYSTQQTIILSHVTFTHPQYTVHNRP